MEGGIKYAMRVAVLTLYCVYAISPIYLSALIGKHDQIVEAGQSAQKVMLGIVWVNVLLSKLVDADRDSTATTPLELKAHGQEREFILIRKKRAVLPDTFRFRPLLEKTAPASITAISPAVPAYVIEVPRRIPVRQEDITLFIHAGLSPPLRFS